MHNFFKVVIIENESNGSWVRGCRKPCSVRCEYRRIVIFGYCPTVRIVYLSCIPMANGIIVSRGADRYKIEISYLEGDRVNNRMIYELPDR